MNKELSDKKKQELEELINESETDAVNYKKSLLPLGAVFLLGGIMAFLALPFVIQGDGINKGTIALVSVCITFGFIGCLGGPFMIFNYVKLKKEEHPYREYVKHFE